jgi:hypothetical protein
MGQKPSRPPLYDPLEFQNCKKLQLKAESYPNYARYILDYVPARIMAQCSIEDQMRFCDAITRRYALNGQFKAIQQGRLMRVDLEAVLPRLTATSIGNMACMAHYNPDPEGFWWQKYTEIIDKLRAA